MGKENTLTNEKQNNKINTGLFGQITRKYEDFNLNAIKRVKSKYHEHS